MIKRTYSITTLTILVLITTFLIAIIPFSYIMINNYNENRQNIINNHIQHTQSISDFIIEHKIEHFNIILDDLKNIENNNLDLIFIKTSKGEIKNYSQSLYDTNSIIKEISKDFLEDRNFLEIKIDNKKYLILLVSKEIVDKQTNRVIGSIFIGEFINNNYNILNEIREKTFTKETFLFAGKELISTTSKLDTKEYKIVLDLIKDNKLDIMHITNDLLIYENKIEDFGSDIKLISLHTNKKLRSFQDIFKRNLISFILIYLGLLFTIYFFVKEYLSYPLEELLNYANNINSNKKNRYEHSQIQEFNQIALGLEKIILSLKDSKERFSLAIDATKDGLWDLNLKNYDVYFSPNYKKMLGYKDNEFPNSYKSWEEAVDKKYIKYVLKEINKHINNETKYFMIEFKMRCKDGSYKWIESRGRAIYDENNKPYRMIGFHTDIEQRKKLELENKQKSNMLMQQAKLAAMGEMIGNIAHQWRQPINNLSLLNITLKQKYLNGKIDKEYIDKFEEKSNKMIQKMSSTIDDFRNFFSPNRSKEIFLPKDAIKNALSMAEASLNNNHISLTQNYHVETKIKNYKNELEQVILNTISNSKDALIKKELVDRKISVYTYENEKNVIIEQIDNGGGIKEDILPKIFDPYFTTKFQDHGTGIGLYMSKVIIEEHIKGSIDIQNFEDGVKVKIIIPKEGI